MAWIQWLRQNSVSLLFIAAIAVLSGAIILSSTQSTGLCGGDTNFTVCIRNWANAAGNLATVLVAALALIVAWGQLKANAAMAELPRLNHRIISAKAAALVVTNFTGHIEVVADMLEDVADRLSQNVDNLALATSSQIIVREWNAVFSDSASVKRISEDVLDIDLEEQISSIIDCYTSLQNEAWSVIHLFRDFIDSQNYEDDASTILYGQTQAQLAIIRIVMAKRYVEDAAKACRARILDMNNVAGALTNIIAQAKIERETLRLR